MIHIDKKENCCGCGACAQKCPQHCISLIEDTEGFLYPNVDINACINCNLCEKVCPIINQNSEREPLNVVGALNNNDSQRTNSSSGGVFILLAKHVLNNGGFVAGAVFDERWEVKHCISQNIDDVYKMMGSKYVQSRTEDTYEKTRALLKQGVLVLYSGSPCQIAGLKRYLQKEYENLITVDFICHGVPSPLVWRDYLKESDIKNIIYSALGIRKKKCKILESPLINNIEFRNKTLRGWINYSLLINGDSKILVSDKCHDNIYMKAFLDNLILRPSCYDCPAKLLKSGSDITLADFWSVEKILPQWKNDDKGTSLLLINTEKGNNILNAINNHIHMNCVSLDSVKQYNSAITESASLHQYRDSFFKEYASGKFSVNYLIVKSCYNSRDRVKLLIKSVLKYCKLYNK